MTMYIMVMGQEETPTITIKTIAGNVVYELIETFEANGDHYSRAKGEPVSLRWERQ